MMEHGPGPAEEFEFSRPASAEETRLETLADLISFRVLGITERHRLRKLAAPGEPLDLIVQGLLAYSDQARYAVSTLDLEDPLQLEKAILIGRERKAIDWQIRLWERILTPIPTEPQEENQS